MFFIAYFFINLCFLNGVYLHRNGDITSCTFFGTNETGICIPIYECPENIKNIKKGIGPQMCTPNTFCCKKEISKMPIVTEKATVKPEINKEINLTNRFVVDVKRTVGTKSREKCIEYSKYVKRRYLDPVATFENRWLEYDSCKKVITTIVGGQDAEPGEFPHMAILQWKNDPIMRCGGSIISERFILTATHCLERKYKPTHVLLGVHNLSAISTERHVQKIDIAQFYLRQEERTTKYNDITLLKLAEKIRFGTEVRPACLYTENTLNTNVLIASGWGATEYTYASVLQKVALNVDDHQKCDEQWRRDELPKLPNGIIDSQICASTKDGRDTCQGDSGGPLQIKNINCIYHIVGLTSFGKTCGADFPAVYTKVSSFIEWIENIVWPN